MASFHILKAFRYSLAGLWACFRDEVAFRQECALAIPHFILVAVVPMEPWMRFALVAIWFLIIAFELINTAIEAVVDLASPERHALAKKAKDCGSAAVLCLLVLLGVGWALVAVRACYDLRLARVELSDKGAE